MKTTKFKYLLSLGCFLATTVLTLESCNESKIDTFVSKPRVWFTKTYQDPVKGTITVNKLERSFALEPGAETIDVPFQVNLIGPIADHDRMYTAVIVDSLTTGNPADYEITPMVIRANHVADTLWIKLIKNPRMDIKADTVTLHIAENDTFGPGYFDGLQVSLVYSNLIIQPDWWTDDMARSYFGAFSTEKFNAFFFYCESLDVEVDIVEELERSDLRKMLIEFKKYIAQEGLTEADGTPMEIPIY